MQKQSPQYFFLTAHCGSKNFSRCLKADTDLVWNKKFTHRKLHTFFEQFRAPELCKEVYSGKTTCKTMRFAGRPFPENRKMRKRDMGTWANISFRWRPIVSYFVRPWRRPLSLGTDRSSGQWRDQCLFGTHQVDSRGSEVVIRPQRMRVNQSRDSLTRYKPEFPQTTRSVTTRRNIQWWWNQGESGINQHKSMLRVVVWNHKTWTLSYTSISMSVLTRQLGILARNPTG